jgi:hypothetical protein
MALTAGAGGWVGADWARGAEVAAGAARVAAGAVASAVAAGAVVAAGAGAPVVGTGAAAPGVFVAEVPQATNSIKITTSAPNIRALPLPEDRNAMDASLFAITSMPIFVTFC